MNEHTLKVEGLEELRKNLENLVKNILTEPVIFSMQKPSDYEKT